MTHALHNSLVRILNTDGVPVGVGFLAAPQVIVTCAHAIEQAAGDSTEVIFDFPLLAPADRHAGRVLLRDETADLAALDPLSLPRGAAPVRLVQSTDLWGHPFRAFGCPAGHDGGVWASGVLRDHTAQGWLHIEDTKETGFAVQPGFSGGPVWDETLGGVVGMVVAAERSPQVKAAFCIPVDVLLQTLPMLAERALPPNPYRGLNYFREQDAALFFGREAFSERLLQAVENRPLTAVVGASGAGKSSVVFAGPLPRLRARPEWCIARFRPADRPFEMLAAALLPLLEPQLSETDRLRELNKLATALRQGEIALADVTEAILRKHGDARFLLLVADQFEELYTLNPDPALRARFVDCLLGALRPKGGLRLVLTLRADFLGQALEHRALSDALREAAEYLGPMTPDELRRAILEPAEKYGVRFEPGLDDLIVEDVAGRPGALPLLEFALTQLWERQENGQLTLNAYRAIGGVEGALARYAESQYTALPPKEQDLARKVLLQLVAPGAGQEDARRLARLRELPPALQVLVPRLADARLVTTDRTPQGEETVEVAHEALIREWERLRAWMEADRAFRLWQERVRAQFRQWQESGGDPDALLRGAPLAQAEAYLSERADEIEPGLADYIRRSREQVEAERLAKERTRRRILQVALSAALLFLILAGVAFWQAAEARRQRNLAQAQQMAATGQMIFDQKAEGPLIGTLLGIEALQRGGALLEADQLVRRGLEVLAVEIGRVRIDEQSLQAVSFSFSSDRFYIVSGGCGKISFVAEGENAIIVRCIEGIVQIWDAVTGREVARITHEGDVYAVAFSPDGRYVVSGSVDGTARVWEAATGREVARMTHEGDVYAVAFSPDGRYVVSGSVDGTARVWEAATGREVARMTHEGRVNAVAFSPDGCYVVSGSADGMTRVWEAKTGREISYLNSKSAVWVVAFSPDGHYVVSGGNDDIARVWEVQTGREVAVMVHKGGVTTIAFSPDGRYVVSGSSDGTARVWETETGREVTRMTHGHRVTAVTFSPDGRYVVSGSDDRTARVWEAESGQEVARMTHEDGVLAVAFSPDGHYVVSGSRNGTSLWETATERKTARMKHEGIIWTIAFSPDGCYVVSGSSDGTARVWEVKSGREIARMIHRDDVKAVAFSPDRRYVISGSSDGMARVWEVESEREVARMTHEDNVSTVAFSPDGRYVVSGSWDGTVVVWEATTGQEITRITNHYPIWVVAFSPNGRYVFSWSGDTTARIWEVETGREIAHMTYPYMVSAVAFSPDGRYVGGGMLEEYAVQVWDMESGRKIAQIGNKLTDMRILNNYLVVIWIEDGSAHLWDTTRDSHLMEIKRNTTTSVAFSSDGRYLVIGSTDRLMQVWDVELEHMVSQIMHEGKVAAVAFSPDGRYVATGNWDGTVQIWLWRSHDLIAEACRRLPRNLTLEEWNQYVGPEIPYHQTCPDKPIPEDVLQFQQTNQQTTIWWVVEFLLLSIALFMSWKGWYQSDYRRKYWLYGAALLMNTLLVSVWQAWNAWKGLTPLYVDFVGIALLIALNVFATNSSGQISAPSKWRFFLLILLILFLFLEGYALTVFVGVMMNGEIPSLPGARWIWQGLDWLQKPVSLLAELPLPWIDFGLLWAQWLAAALLVLLTSWSVLQVLRDMTGLIQQRKHRKA